MATIDPKISKATPAGPTSPEDFTVIGDLLETIERDPASNEARKILAQQYEAFGWIEAAEEVVRAILDIAPGDADATAWLASKKPAQPSTPNPLLSELSEAVNVSSGLPPLMSAKQLGNSYQALLSDARSLHHELMGFQNMIGSDLVVARQIHDIAALSEGRFTSLVKAKPPPAARAMAAKMKSDPSPLELALQDLEANARWIRIQSSREDHDEIRNAVRKRAEAVKTALPPELKDVVNTAFMHMEHELLGREYVNGKETMLGDPVVAIPRDRFWSSEDGYGWDMSELAEAIKANSGIMRNPLSKQMFTQADVRAITRHECGRSLAALQLEQKQLTQGVRSETIKRLDKMADVLLDDQSADAVPSREAVDEYLTFVATLPDAEQKALDSLRVPASDSHTGQQFDVTIGAAVADAKANRQCFHKTGDHLRQAARYLRNNSPAEARMPGAWN